ncbi:AlpA family transcriptional regulator [uncultured Ferrovibrio sp.]|jgi:Predicted transcriptional regulator|uniref:helix-turn-helix transcriptional regulator n=1 Tax=uncultured Ferrovibrio sp. TaxID=1576913 RepID=UPI00262F9C4D|nr:AlpA family transcriptional regulator [uncultured Ferrovibrio sp.]
MTVETIGLGRILRLPEVKRETGLSRATIYRKIKAGDFPAPVELSRNSVGWYESEIAAWKANRPRRSVKPWSSA